MRSCTRSAALLLALCSLGPPVAADTADGSAPPEEPYNTGWTVNFENDAIIGRDQQFTGGGSVELTGRRAAEFPWSLDPVLGFINRLTGFGRLGNPATQRHGFSAGLAVFTPDDLEDPDPIQDDHPYASLLTMGNTRQTVDRANDVRYKSSFFLGILGTDAGEFMQDVFHEVVGSTDPQGWDNQISDGGEPTLLYRVSRQKLIDQGSTGGGRSFDWRYDTAGTAGFITDVSIGTSVRWGRIGRRWWTFDPASSEYLDLGGPLYTSAEVKPREWFVWFGAKGRLRLYNALLEGQFRDSEVTFSRDELDVVIGEIATGVTADIFDTNLRASFEIRARTRELPGGAGDEPIFARISISRRF